MHAFAFTFGLSVIMEAINQTYDLHGNKFSLLFSQNIHHTLHKCYNTDEEG